MGMTLEERRNELVAKRTTQGIGENEVKGGNANNNGYNSGIVEGGLAYDSGLGNGSINGGSARNNNLNEDVISGGTAINKGNNDGYVSGGNAINDGINQNTLLAGSAGNELGSVNKENSFIQGGDAIRAPQQGVKVYDNIQNQLNQTQEDYTKIKARIETGEADSHTFSQAEKQKLDLLLKEKNDEINQLNVDMKNKFNEIEELTNKIAEKDGVIKDIVAQLEATDKQKNDLQVNLSVAENKKNYLSEKVANAQKEINEIKEDVRKYKEMISDNQTDKNILNEKISELEIELDKKKVELDKGHQLIELNEEKIHDLNADIDLIKDEYIKKEKRLKEQLDEIMEKVSTLEEERKDKQSECSSMNVDNPKESRVPEVIKDNEGAKLPNSTIVNGGCVQNSGTNVGLIHAGNSQSITMNNKININHFANDSMVNKLSESMNSFVGSTESVSCQILGRVECNTQPVMPVVVSNFYPISCG